MALRSEAQSELQLKQPVAVLGLGATGRSVMNFLQAQGFAPVGLASDSELARCAPPATLVISPGVPRSLPAIRQLEADGCEIIGDIELFARAVNLLPAERRPRIAALTGSNGKSTVVTLLAEMARKAGFSAVAAGNIGLPVLELFADLPLSESPQLPQVVVLELSSFQLESLSSLKADTACVLNVSEDHLDRYRDFAHYRQTKLAIYSLAAQALTNRDDPLTVPAQLPARQISFGFDKPPRALDYGISNQQLVRGTEPLMPVSELAMAGSHNAANALAALALGEQLDLPLAPMLATLGEFTGLEHRCQLIHTARGVRWLNDSKATNVGATLAALEGLATGSATACGTEKKSKLILIAGGDGKGADFSPLKSVFNRQVDELICLGRDGDKLAALRPGSHTVDSLRAAVTMAAELAAAGDTVLLSPACASLDMFKNYQQRGEQFAQLARELG